MLTVMPNKTNKISPFMTPEYLFVLLNGASFPLNITLSYLFHSFTEPTFLASSLGN